MTLYEIVWQTNLQTNLQTDNANSRVASRLKINTSEKNDYSIQLESEVESDGKSFFSYDAWRSNISL